METATLTQCAHSVGEGVVQVMEEHLVETMSATQQEGHDPAEHWITAGGILGQELVPPVGMVEVGEERPGDGEASSASDGHGQEETPALREGPSKWPGAKEPHTGPKACYEKAMTETIGNPLAPEVFVALATCTLIWEVGVPKQSEQTSSVIGTNPMPHRYQWHCQPAIPLVCPFLQDIEPGCWVPTELSMHQQVHCAGVVPLVLQH